MKIGQVMRGSRNFAGGCPDPTAREQLWQHFFCFFLVLNLFYSGLSMVNFKGNYNFPRFQRGSNMFQGVQFFPGEGGGSNFFQLGDSNANFYKNP